MHEKHKPFHLKIQNASEFNFWKHLQPFLNNKTLIILLLLALTPSLHLAVVGPLWLDIIVDTWLLVHQVKTVLLVTPVRSLFPTHRNKIAVHRGHSSEYWLWKTLPLASASWPATPTHRPPFLIFLTPLSSQWSSRWLMCRRSCWPPSKIGVFSISLTACRRS